MKSTPATLKVRGKPRTAVPAPVTNQTVDAGRRLDSESRPEWAALYRNVSRIASDVAAQADEKRLRQLVETAMQGVVPVSPNVDREAAMLVRARTQLLSSGDWITAAQIARTAGLSDVNPSARMNRWKKAGEIFAIQHNGTDYFPLYGLDQVNWRPLPALKPILDVLRPHRDDWGIAYWFASINGMLGNRAPKDVVKRHPGEVEQAARVEIEEELHPHG